MECRSASSRLGLSRSPHQSPDQQIHITAYSAAVLGVLAFTRGGLNRNSLALLCFLPRPRTVVLSALGDPVSRDRFPGESY